MGGFPNRNYNIAKRLDSCQLSNLGFFKDTLLVIVNEREESKGNPGKGKMI
jgi:hypothetical protein